MEGEHARRSAIRAATLAATLLIAQQVGAKATRDALFLETFDVSVLPRALALTALVTVALVAGASRLLTRSGPTRVVPFALVGSAILHVGVYLVWNTAPGAAAFAYYLVVGATGALLVSGFWSIVTETLDPATARRNMGRIGTGATLGGLLGGVTATAVGRALGAESLLLLLAVLHLLAAGILRTGIGPTNRTAKADDAEDGLRRGWSVLRRETYVRDLATVVVVLSVGAACLDYVFKDVVQARFASPDAGLDLVAFFGVFHTLVALATFVLQSTLAPLLLARAGLARTMATHPAGLALGAGALALVPLWPVAAAARGLEGSLRNSLFRSAYEPLYTPLAAADRRASKSLIDVGGERFGDALGAGLVQAALLLVPATLIAAGALHTVLLVASVLMGALGLVVARRLHHGYVEALAGSLRRHQLELDSDAPLDATTRTMILRARHENNASPANAPVRPAPQPRDPLLTSVERLHSTDSTLVVRELATSTPLRTELIGHVVPLLAWDAVAENAVEALRASGPRVIGPLLSAVLDDDESFAVRRRAPRALPSLPDRLVVEGLLRGLECDRFEIRYQCARTLGRLHAIRPLEVPATRVMDLVLREVSVVEGVWASHRLLDGRSSGPLFADSPVADRVPVALEHVFDLLGLVLPPEALRLSLEGLLTRDPQLRGTALEYLDGVLPATVRAALWPKLRVESVESAQRSGDPRRALETLMGSRQRIRSLLDDQRTDPGV